MKDSSQPRTTRDALLDASDRLLARNGYKKMTIAALAREVGIGKGSVYLHFASKEEIALAHLDRMVEDVKNRLWAIAGQSLPPDERLIQMLVERVLMRFDNVQRYMQSLNELLSYLRPQLLERRKRYFDDEARIVAAVVVEAQDASILLAGEAFEIAQMLVTATNALMPYSLSSIELEDRADVEIRVRKLAALLIRGLRV